MKTMYCVTFIDNSSNDINNNWRMVIGINSNGIESTPDYEYNLTIEEAEAQLTTYQEIAKRNGWDWASFQIEDNEWMINEIEDEY